MLIRCESFKKKEIVLNDGMGYVYGLISWVRRHPYLSATGVIITLLIGGIAFGQLTKSKDSNGIAASTITYTPPVNESDVKVTPTPQFDYYDKELGKGFYIEGPPSFVNNVTRLMETWKEVDPKIYFEYIGNYTPNKIVISRDRFCKYAQSIEVIALPETLAEFGGRDELTMRKNGLPNIYAEWDNALKEKSGYIKSFKEQEKSRIDYAVKLNVLTQEQADGQFKAISGTIDDGTYFYNSKLNQT